VKGSHIRPSVLNGPRKKWGTLGLDTWLFSTRRIETSAIVFRG